MENYGKAATKLQSILLGEPFLNNRPCQTSAYFFLWTGVGPALHSRMAHQQMSLLAVGCGTWSALAAIVDITAVADLDLVSILSRTLQISQ